MRVFPFTFILLLNNGYTQKATCSLPMVFISAGAHFQHQPAPEAALLECGSQLNQRGLANLLRIISFLPRSQRQLPHKKQARRQRSHRDKMNSGGDANVQKLESASRRQQDSHTDCHEVSHSDSHQSPQPHRPVDLNRTQSSTGTAAIHWRHLGGPPMRDSAAAVTSASPDDPRYELATTQWPPICPVAHHLSSDPPPVHAVTHHLSKDPPPVQ